MSLPLAVAVSAVVSVAALVAHVPPAAAQSFVNFESGHVRPLALSPDGGRLFAVNTPDNRLAIYTVGTASLTLAAEVPVGLEPVAVATRVNGTTGRTEAWVVNHLSDSISIVELDPADVTRSRVIRTLLVGDEPRDILFAGAAGDRAFITCAHRGQNRPGDPQLTTEGIGRADVWAFAAEALGAPLGGTPLTIVTLFGDTPRALARSVDGATVFAAVFHSGSRTTTIPQPVVDANFGLPPPPPMAPPNPPDVGLIVAFNPANNRWEDELARNWTPFVPFSLPDQDVFLIDANANPPALAGGANTVVGVGTILFNMAVRPTNGRLFVTNLDARNEVRFENFLQGNQGVQGHIAESRITVVNGTTPTPVHLNPHIDYSVPTGSLAETEQSRAFPTDLVFSSDGLTLYVAALGSRRVAVFDAGSLESGSIVADHIEVGGGPSGLALDEVRNQLYVMNRFDHTLSIVTDVDNPSLRAGGATVSLRYDPSPPEVRNGRQFLYDARTLSGHGDSACASCHIFGDMDSLAWDLGDPQGSIAPNPNPFRVGGGGPFHPLKGPMTTQSLRGMADAGPMHWRGDRTGGSSGGDPLDEDAAFKAFNPAFQGLLGRADQLTPAEMQAFTDFALTLRYPPNPIRALDNSLTPQQANGRAFFDNTVTDAGTFTCDFCHTPPLGTDGLSSIEGEPQEFKIAHLRNLYQKVGMFGVPAGVPGIPATGFLGPQVRGSGFLHDGSISTVFDFVNNDVFFNFTDTSRREVEAFLLAFDTGLAPIVGQQVSVTAATVNDATIIARINLLIARDDAGDCELIAKSVVGGGARGAVYVGANQFQSDRDSENPISAATLRGLADDAPGQEQVYTCVPPSSGIRMGIDRDEDGFGDRTELDAGSDPANPNSVPGGATPTPTVAPTPTRTATPIPTQTATPTIPGPTPTAGPLVLIQTTSMKLQDDSTPPSNPDRRKFTFKASTTKDPVANRIVPPAPGSAGDPTGSGTGLGGATLTVYNGTGSGESFSVVLPFSGWESRTSGSGTRYTYRGERADAVTKITVRENRLDVRGGRAAWGYTLDEPSQGRMAMRLTLGSGVTWCADAPPKTSGNPPSSERYDKVDRYQAASKSPAPVGCP